MTLASAVRVLLRRWLVIVIGLVLTLGAAGYLYLNTPPRYQATARMLLLLPSDARGELAVGSPFLYLPNGLNVLARIVAMTPDSREFRSNLLEQGLTSQYEVGVDTTSPTITVSVEGDDPENVIATRDGVIKAVQDDLLAIQREENAPRAQTAHTRVYAAEPTPDQISGDRLRGVLAVVGAGGLLTLLAAFGIEALSQARKARKERRAAAGQPKKSSRRKAGTTAAEPEAEAAVAAQPAADAERPAFGLQTAVQDAAYSGEDSEADATVATGGPVTDGIDAAAPADTLATDPTDAEAVAGDPVPAMDEATVAEAWIDGFDSGPDEPRRAVDGADSPAEAPDESPAHR